MRLPITISFGFLALAVEGRAQPPDLPPPELPPPAPASLTVALPNLVPTLIRELDDPDPEVRQNLALALAGVGASAVPPLIDALRDPHPDRRASAAYALGQMGAEAEPALEALLPVLNDVEPMVRRQSSYAISRIIASVRRTEIDPGLPIPPPDPPPFSNPLGDAP